MKIFNKYFKCIRKSVHMQSTEKMTDVKEQAIADDIVALLQGEDIDHRKAGERRRERDVARFAQYIQFWTIYKCL